MLKFIFFSFEHPLFFFCFKILAGVETICEIGFNAGHSAGVFLISNPQARVISFDLGNFAYSEEQVRYISSLFPNRLTYVKGNTQTKIKEFAMEHPSLKCDLWSIADNSPNTELNFEGCVLHTIIDS